MRRLVACQQAERSEETAGLTGHRDRGSLRPQLEGPLQRARRN